MVDTRCFCHCHALDNFGWDQKTTICGHCVQPLFTVGEKVQIDKDKWSPIYEILECKKHGTGFCDCCGTAKVYFLYRFGSDWWVNEIELIKLN